MKSKGYLAFISTLLIVFGATILVSSSLSRQTTEEIVKKEIGGQVGGQTFNPPSGTDVDGLSSPKGDEVLVTKVVDGDTVELEGGQKVRYIGIDTPETVDPRKSVQCFGKEATAKNRSLVEGKKVKLEKDISETDKYGRLLRYIWVGDTLMNEILVKEGFAHSSPYPPDVKLQDRFNKAEKFARENNKGLWGVCDAVGVTNPTYQTQSQSGQCLIKGNISSSGEKIYHLLGQKYYDKIVIDESKGERWFCSEQEALDSRWRKSKT
ncbi:MAG: thermonuclease family protein [Candidatus Woykebacteria bacterium]